MPEQWLMVGRIARFSLRRSWLAILAFSGALLLFQATLIWGYAFIGGQATVQNVISTLSPELRRALKIVPSLQGGFGPREYVALGLYHPIYLGLGAAFGASRAAEALAGSIERNSVLLLLSRPVRRTTHVLGEALALIIGVALVALAGLAGLALGLATTDLGVALPFGPYAVAAAGGALLFAALALIALLLSALTSRTPTAAGLGSAMALGGFVLDLLPWTSAAPLAWFNPWHFYDPPTIIESGIVWRDVGALTIISLVATLLTMLVWRRRNMVGG